MKQFLLICACLFFVTPAWAVTRYVDKTGATGCSTPSDTDYDPNTGVCGSGSSTVYNSIHAGVLGTSAGDTLIIRGDTYTSGFMNDSVTYPSGTAGNVITIKAYPGETVTLSASGGNAIALRAPSYWNIGATDGSIVIDGATTADNCAQVGTNSGAHHITLTNIEIKNCGHIGLFFHYPGHHNTFTRGSVHDTGNETAFPHTANFHYGIYDEGESDVVEYSHIYDNRDYGIHSNDSNAGRSGVAHNNVYRYNRIHGNSTAGYSQGQAISTRGGNQFYRNVIYGCANHGIILYNSNADDNLVYNNTISGCAGNGIYVQNDGGGNPTGIIIKNNISYHTSGTGIELGTATVTISNNLCRAGCTVNSDPLFTNSASNDYSLAASSPAIDAGTAIVGFNYNSTAPDLGAFETFTHATCSVEDGDASTLRITFNNNVYPPLQVTNTTGFTTRKAGASNAPTAIQVVGDNTIYLTLTNAIVAGNAVDYSYAQTGDLRDSANIGGSLTQEYLAITQQSCTNNVGAAASHLFIQAKFEFHGLRGTEAAPVVLPYSAAAENTNINVVVGGKARLRLAVTCTTADCPPTGFFLYYSKDGGAYAVVPDTFGADNIAFCGTSVDTDIPTSGTATTDQLSTAGTFVAAALVRTSNAIPTIDLAQNNKTEPEYCIAWDTDATADATYDFRIYKQDASAIDTYTVTPRATVRAMSAGLGF